MSLLWTPGGMIDSERKVIKCPIEYMRMLAVFANTNEDIRLDLKCRDCGQAMSGRNSSADKQWKMECACRTFIGANPTARPM